PAPSSPPSQTAASARSFIGVPLPPYRSATTSARIARAVSAGWRPPRSSPTGPRNRASSASLTPASSSRARRSACGLRDPTPPPRSAPRCRGAARGPGGGRGPIDVEGGQQGGPRVVGPGPVAGGPRGGPAAGEPIDVGEAFAGRERGPAVDDDRLIPELVGEP